jgi:hypothetical protein
MPILVKTERLGAPIRMVQGNLFENNFPNNKWELYDLCIISDKEITKEVKYALSTTMKIVPIEEATKRDMVLECSSDKTLPIPLIEPGFIKRYMKFHNNKNFIEEVEIDYENSSYDCVKIKNIRSFKNGWSFSGKDQLTKYHENKKG